MRSNDATNPPSPPPAEATTVAEDGGGGGGGGGGGTEGEGGSPTQRQRSRRSLLTARQMQSTASIRAILVRERSAKDLPVNWDNANMEDGKLNDVVHVGPDDGVNNRSASSFSFHKANSFSSIASAASAESWMEEVRRLQEQGQLTDEMLSSILAESTSASASSSGGIDAGGARHTINISSNGTPLEPSAYEEEELPTESATYMDNQHGLNDEEVLQQYRLMAIHEAGLRLQAWEVAPTNTREEPAVVEQETTTGNNRSRNDAFYQRIRKMPEMRPGPALPAPRPVGPPKNARLNAIHAEPSHRATSCSVVVSKTPRRYDGPRVAQGSIVASSNPADLCCSGDNHLVQCMNKECGKIMTLHKEIFLAICPVCRSVSPATTY